MAVKSMKSVMHKIRQETPELDQRLHAARRREKLALALHGLRVNANLTQNQVAERMGKDQAHISRMESLTGPFPDMNSITAYAHACQSSAGYVFVTRKNQHSSVVAVPLGNEEEDERLVAAMRAHNVEIAGNS